MGVRKQALKPIQTKVRNSTSYDEIKEEVEEDGEPVSPGGRLFHEPNFNVHILVNMGCKTKVDPAVIKDNLPRTLLKHPRFSSLPVEEGKDGMMRWVRTEVDLDKHVIIPDVDVAECEHDPNRVLEDYVHGLTKTRLDKSRPLWDLHILNVETSRAKGTVILRVHHSLGDGISLMSLLLACMRQSSNAEALPTIPTANRRANHDLKRSGFVGFLWLWWILKLFWNTCVDVFLFIATALFLVKDTDTPIKGPPGSENNPRRIVYRIVKLDDLKLVKNSMNMTINDVALGITQAGLSQYLNRRYGHDNKTDIGRTEKYNNLPKNILLRSILFINIRPSAGIQALADMMEKNTKAKWGNWFGYVLLPFSIRLKDDPLDYVRQAKATIDRKKHSLEALCSFSIAGIVYNFFGIKASSCLFQRLFTSTTMAFSNVVGPVEEVSFFGHPMAYLVANTYGQASELLVCFQSYMNEMSISLSVDENTISDPHQLCDDIVESLKLLKDTVIKKGLIKK